MKSIFYPLALLTLAGGQDVARADAFGPETRTVSYRDLDLSQARDVRTLRNRVARAVVEVCAPPSSTGLPSLGVAARCRKETAQRMRIHVAKVVRGGRDVAENAAGTRRSAVSIADLDLGRSQDRQAFGRRLALAVAQACGVPQTGACRAELRHQPPAMVTRVAVDRTGPDAG